jgi:hypothetical protein
MKAFKTLSTFLLTGLLFLTMTSMTANADSLDDVISGNGDSTVQEYDTSGESGGSNNGEDLLGGAIGDINGDTDNENVNRMKDATKLDGHDPNADKVNQGLKKVISFIVQILSYAATLLLVLRVLLDIIYISIPFSRAILANGYAGSAQAAGQNGMQGGMGGMSGGMGMGGMNRMGGMQGGMGMGQPQGQAGASSALGRIQWVSTAALNAAEAEKTVGPDGKAINPLKLYAKDMTIILVLAPLLLVLAVTGVLTRLGILIGTALANFIDGIGNMI